MSRDTKLRMSIDQNVLDRLNELFEQITKATEHKSNAYELKQLRLSVPDSTDYIFFDFNSTWSVRRCQKKEGIYDRFAKDGWEVTGVGDTAMITTFGKMAVDISREIEEQLAQVQIQIDLIEDPVYCPVCDHCGETGCCGFIGFLEHHVRGKTDCTHEDQILDDLEEWIKNNDE